jgi:hypothetical protein
MCDPNTKVEGFSVLRKYSWWSLSYHLPLHPLHELILPLATKRELISANEKPVLASITSSVLTGTVVESLATPIKIMAAVRADSTLWVLPTHSVTSGCNEFCFTNPPSDTAVVSTVIPTQIVIKKLQVDGTKIMNSWSWHWKD